MSWDELVVLEARKDDDFWRGNGVLYGLEDTCPKCLPSSSTRRVRTRVRDATRCKSQGATRGPWAGVEPKRDTMGQWEARRDVVLVCTRTV